MRRLSLLLTATIVTGVALAAGAAAANASAAPAISASPASVGVGEVTTVTATGLGGLETADFGLGDVSGVAMLSSDGSTYDTTATADVSDGTASVSFMASAAGSYVVDVTNGEEPLAETTVTVTGGSDQTPSLSASPASVAVGAESTITASGLGGLETAEFGLASSSGASVDPTSATVSDGTATTTFTATEPGTYTVDVTDGETSLAQVEVTVTAATPTQSPTPPPTPPDTGVPAWVFVVIIVVVVLVIVGLLVTVIVQSRRRRGGGTPGA